MIDKVKFFAVVLRRRTTAGNIEIKAQEVTCCWVKSL